MSHAIERCSDDVFFRPTVKLASPWLPWQKPIGFWIIVENKLCDQQKLYVYVYIQWYGMGLGGGGGGGVKELCYNNPYKYNSLYTL